VTLAIAATAAHVWYHHPRRRELARPAALLAGLVLVQITLGALTVLTARNPWINSFHVVCGATVLATSLVLTLRAWRARFGAATATVLAKPDTAGPYLGHVRLQPDGTRTRA
jgi:cytochrome c oxidase assembly protein subunit 15